MPFLEKLLQSSMLGQMLLPNYITSAIFSNLVTWTHQKYVKCNEIWEWNCIFFMYDQNIFISVNNGLLKKITNKLQWDNIYKQNFKYINYTSAKKQIIL